MAIFSFTLRAKGSVFVARLKSLFALQTQRFNHTLEHSGVLSQFDNDMGSDSLVEKGQPNFSKWRKVNPRTFGISRSMIPSSPWIVLKILQARGFESYLVGGCVRDLILNKKPKDFDVITTATLRQIRKRFHRAEIIGRRFPICRVHVKGTVVEVSSFQTVAQHQKEKEKKNEFQAPLGCNERDLLLWRNSMDRDFTVNSLFFDPIENKIYDYANGIKDLKSLKLQTLIPAQLSFEEDCARILRGLRIAARLGLQFSKETDTAIRRLSSSVATLSKDRIMMELNYMFSYGAAEPSFCLLKKFNLLEILLPFHAAHFFEPASNPSERKCIMLNKLFFHLDRLVSCDRPSDCSLWVGLLAFHLALVKDPQHKLVVFTFASVLYHGIWEKGVEHARLHAESSIIFEPEILKNFDSISDCELAKKVTQLALLVRDSINILTDTVALLEIMCRLPAYPCLGLVFVSKKVGKGVAELFDGMLDDVESYASQKESTEIDYKLLGKGNVQETRFTIGKIILETMGCKLGHGGEVTEEINHLLSLSDPEPKVLEYDGICSTSSNSKRFRSMDKLVKEGKIFQSNLEPEEGNTKRQKVVQKSDKVLGKEIRKRTDVLKHKNVLIDKCRQTTLSSLFQ